MTNRTFEDVWTTATGHAAPFPYQRRLGMEGWPDVLSVPTGLGKTAAVGLSWIYKRMTNGDAPRRLVYCLPMRVLAEQTVDEFSSWLSKLERLGQPGEGKVSVSLLMGGEEGLQEADWARHPSEDAVLIGTQDMLLSRALMRGYGMSRYQWPVHFALLHNDAMWIFDEVQLMGPALATSAQLDAFRSRCPGGAPSRSLWLSATLREEWLATVDFAERVAQLRKLEIDDDDRSIAGDRVNATKRLHRAQAVLDLDGSRAHAAQYLSSLAEEVLERHKQGEQTLVLVNRVERAQELARKLKAGQEDVPVLLVHARFRAAERRKINDELRRQPGSTGRIIVATQAIEAGVDMTCRTQFAELAPWSSMVQRFGRCNRYGEHAGGADIYWIDITEDADEAAPYEEAALSEARDNLGGLTAAGPSELPPVSSDRPIGQVLRWKDLTDLFNTDPDLSGFDIDVSPYIRDQGTPQVQVFWKEFDERPTNELAATRDELCPVSLGQMQKYLKKQVRKRPRTCWIWDPLLESWQAQDRRDRVQPGSTLLLRAAAGGYDHFLGFAAESTKEVTVVEADAQSPANETYASAMASRSRQFVSLAKHVEHVVEEMSNLATAVGAEEEKAVLETAALWHDVGKAHPAFQTAMLDYADDREVAASSLWAKSSGSGRPRYRVEAGDEVQPRRYFRHELASMLAWLATSNDGDEADLIAYLIAAHHGKVRMGLRALPPEGKPPDERLFARGVWDGDTLPSLILNGIQLPETTLRLDIMRIGRGEMGPSWTERTARLLEKHGPFGLAWLEALLRIADWRASAAEDRDGS